MFKLFKVVSFVSIFIIGFFWYIFYTPMGQQNAYHFFGDYLSKKTDLDIEIKYINLSNYPHIEMNSIVAKKFKLDINANIENLSIKGKYILQNKCIHTLNCINGDNIYIVGKMDIKNGYMTIDGKGKGLNGDIKYSLKKIDDRYRDIKLKLMEINSTRLAKLLDQKAIFEGRANVEIDFDLIDKNHQKGVITYSVEDKDFYNLDVKLKSTIFVEDKKHKFNISLLSKGMRLDIYDGRYDIDSKYLHSFYKLNIDEVSNLKYMRDINLSGNVFSKGEVEYDKTIFIKGFGKSLEHYVKFLYKDNNLSIDIDNNSSSKVKNHIRLSNIKLYPKDKAIDTDVDINIDKYNVDGNLYLKYNTYLSNPKLDDTYLKYKGKIQKHYNLNLDGVLNKSMINMTYTLGSHRLPSHICTIVNDVNLSGYLNGYWNLLHINANGKALDGGVSFDLVKIDDRLEDVSIELKKVHAQKLFTLFGKPSYPHGWTNATLKFKTLSKNVQKGSIFYSIDTSKILDTPFQLNTNIDVDNNIQTFKANIKLANSDINITKGQFNSDTNKTYMFYKADIRDVSKLEKIITHKYYGSIYAVGEVFYDKDLKVLGMSKSYGGVLDYKYHKDRLNINLSDVYLKNILHIFHIPKLLDAKTSGDINYDFKSKKVVVDTKLSQGRFLPSKLSKTIHKKAGFDLEKEIFDNSSLYLTYHNGLVLGNLLLKNKSGTISLREAKIDTKRDKINAYFDFDMIKQKFSGKIYGRLSSPKVNLDMQKLIEFQMDSQLDNIMGKQNREMMENLPMGNVAKDIGTGMAGSFMGIFF